MASRIPAARPLNPIFASQVRLVARGTDGKAAPVRIELARKRRSAQVLRDHFRCPIVFGATHDGSCSPKVRAKRIGSFKTIEQGAATTIFCATSPRLDGRGGVYCEDADIALVTTEGDTGVRPYAIDPEIAQRLWDWTERQL